MNNIMLDVESMGRDANAALVAIGAVFFDEHTGQLGPTFYRAIHLSTSVNLGFKMEPATVLFWLGQPEEARRAILFNSVHVADAFADFVDWVKEHGPKDKAELRMWGCSPTFDCVKVEAHLKALDLEVPWFYWAERDYRTIRERNKVVPQDERTGLHNALEDAKFQASHLIKIRQHHVNKTR